MKIYERYAQFSKDIFLIIFVAVEKLVQDYEETYLPLAISEGIDMEFQLNLDPSSSYNEIVLLVPCLTHARGKERVVHTQSQQIERKASEMF
jgi:hypothetical protein